MHRIFSMPSHWSTLCLTMHCAWLRFHATLKMVGVWNPCFCTNVLYNRPCFSHVCFIHALRLANVGAMPRFVWHNTSWLESVSACVYVRFVNVCVRLTSTSEPLCFNSLISISTSSGLRGHCCQSVHFSSPAWKTPSVALTLYINCNIIYSVWLIQAFSTITSNGKKFNLSLAFLHLP